MTERTLEEFHFKRPVDQEKFVSDYNGMLGLFRRHGVETLLLREVLAHDEDALADMDRRPNLAYTRDLAVIFSRGAVLMRPYLKGRWWDHDMVGRAFERLGVPLLGAIEPPGFLEAGEHLAPGRRQNRSAGTGQPQSKCPSAIRHFNGRWTRGHEWVAFRPV